MGLLGKLWVKLGLDSSEFQKGVKDADKATTSFKDRLKTLGQAVGVAFGIGAIVQFSRKVIQTRGEFESLEISFRTLLKSKSAADQLMAQMVDLAARTPFSLQEVATGAKQLLAYGFAASEVRGTLSQLGDVAAGLGLPMGRLTYLYGTTRTQGRLFARDLMQFTTSGVPLLDELAKMFGKSTEEINKMVSAGDIGFEEVKQAFGNMTGEAGKFYNLMEERSKGISGKISNLGDAISVMFNKIGQSQEGAINSALDGAKFLVDNYQEVWSILKALIITYGTYKAVLITVAAVQKASIAASSIKAAYDLAKGVKSAKDAMLLFNMVTKLNPLVLIAGAIAGVVGALALFGSETNKANDSYSAFSLQMQQEKSTLADLKKALSETAYGSKERADIINLINQRYKDYLPSLLTEKDSIDKITSALTKANEKLTENLRLKLKASRLEEIQSTQLGVETNFVSSFTDAYKSQGNKTPEQIALFANSLAQMTQKAREGGASVDDARKVLIALGHDAKRVNGAIISSDNSISKQLRTVISWFSSIADAAGEANTQTAVLNALVADIGGTTGGGEKEVVETYRTRAEILADIKAKTAEISALEAKPKKTSSEIKNLEALRGELKTYEDEYKTFTGKEFGAKVKVETDKDKTENAAKDTIAYFENEISKRQLAIKLTTNDADIKEWQKEIAGFEVKIKAKLEVETPKSERQTIEDAIKGYADLQNAIPIGMGTPEELQAAQAEWDRLDGLIKQAREELEKFPKTTEIFPVGSLDWFNKEIATATEKLGGLAGAELTAAQAAIAMLEVQKKGAESGWQTKLEQETDRLNLLKKALEEATEAQKKYAQEAVDAQQIVVDNLDDNKKAIQQFNDDVSAALEAGAIAGIVALGTAIGALAMGKSGGDVWAILLAPIADMAIQLGEIAIAAGIGIAAIKTAFESMHPAVAIAAGVALVTLGTAIKGAITNMSSKGSSSTSTGGNNNTFTGGYSNGSSNSSRAMQFASPQQQVIVLDTRVSGSDIIFAQAKEQNRRNR